ncbi:MAG: sodium-dependent transporter [Ruminococcus sp.]|nr:sodium-dependent transporter [Ruminococcus sp.]
MNEKRNSFSSTLGFVLAAAGSAIGLGNIWRFPYLAAKDGGGLFLVVYIVLALTFGYTLMMSEVSIGRKTKQSCLTAYGTLSRSHGWLGIAASIVPFMILPYYAIIGGWVLKYAVAFCSGQGRAAAEDGYFTDFITAQISPIVFDIIFLAATAFIIYRGVNKGIEAISKVLMPALLLVVIGIAIFAVTIKGSDGRTGLDGLKVLFIPDLAEMTPKGFFIVVLDAMGQLFYSISVAMGIMVTYGSYFKDDSNLVKSVNQIEFFDTLVAILAGVMVIPPVFAFMGRETMESTAGPSLMFVALPKVFAEMGFIGNIVGAVFFIMVLFAALTSCISILEAVVAGLIDRFGWSRKKATLIESSVAMIIGIFICLGYNLLYFEVKLPNGSKAQLLDIFDYISNNLLMPIVAIGTCILVGWVIKPKTIIEEATKNGERFGRKHLFIVMVKFVTPLLLIVLLLGSMGVYEKLGLMK